MIPLDSIQEILQEDKHIQGDLISRSALIEEIKSLSVFVTGLRAGKGILNEYAKQYRDSLLRVVNDQPTLEVKDDCGRDYVGRTGKCPIA